MSVAGTQSNSSTTSASARLAQAIAAGGGSEHSSTNEAAGSTVPGSGPASRPKSDAARGANGAPGPEATGANAAADGAGELGSTAYTPYQASTDAYQAQSGTTGAGSSTPTTPSTPEPGRDAGSVASADGPTAADVAPPGQPGMVPKARPSAWTRQWEQRFSELMQRMGMSKGEIAEQLKGVAGQPTTEAQLQEAYSQMEASLGDFDDVWRTKFTMLMDELKTPAKDREQVLAQLAGSGLTDAQLQDAYAQMQAAKPAWNAEWETKFKTLDVPEELLTQLKDSGAPKEALEQQFQKLLDTKMEYHRDGRLKRLEEADATPAEKWGVMLEGKKGEEFDKLVEQIHSSHVSGWKRVGSFALNLIPGVYAVQYLTGKDWVTGEKIDRSNPLNIIGAVASGFAGFTAIRSAVQGVQGLSAASRAAQATMQAANAGKAGTSALGLAASVEAMGKGSALSRGAFQAIEGANLVSKFEKGLRFTDYLKAATPLVNRFGEAGRLSAVGRGYFQGMQLAAGAAALKTVEGGGAAIDKTIKAGVLDQLKQGKGIEEALAAARPGSGASFTFNAADVAANHRNVGFLQGGVNGRFGVGNGSGSFTLNPFKNHNTIASTSNPNVLSLGRTVNFGTNGGLAQGLGAVQGMGMANASQATRAATVAGANQLMQGEGAIAGRVTGLGGITDEAQRISTLKRTAYWADKLGAGRFSQASSIANVVERGGSGGYRAARTAGDLGRRFGGYVATPLVGGAAVGMTGRQMQPGWEYVKNRDQVVAKEQSARETAEKEAQELERLYQEQHGTAGASDAQAGAAETAPANGQTTSPMTPQVVGTSPQSGGQLVFDPSIGVVYDTKSGDVYDPNTGQKVGNLAQQQAGAPTPNVEAGSATGGAAPSEVYVDPKTGYYVDPSTGLMADPATGQVYDPRSGAVVANLNAQQPAA